MVRTKGSRATNLRDRAQQFFAALQDRICERLEFADGKARFHEDLWQREGGGGGRTRVMQSGDLFEKGGVNYSAVHGELSADFAAKIGPGDDRSFFATGVSLVLHAQNPYVPTVHANFRYLEKGENIWFGGGCDLTPCYPDREDVVHFHRTLKEACDRHNPDYYTRFKHWCDDYFLLRHRKETRGVGGIFFDYLKDDPERVFAFVRDAADSFLPAYLPIAERQRSKSFGEREKEFQLVRRGRYVEFNLLYDRGTIFGLETGGRTESILMSLPPLARWLYDYQPVAGTAEAEAMGYFHAHDWLGIEDASTKN